MPCIFCIAMLAMVGSAVASAALDRMQERLREKASAPVERTVDSSSVARFETEFEVAGKRAPVVVTVYKDSGRVRIQVLTHELSRDEIEELEDLVAELLEAEIVDRTDAEDEEPVREAMGEHRHEHEHDHREDEPQSERGRDVTPDAVDTRRAR